VVSVLDDFESEAVFLLFPVLVLQVDTDRSGVVHSERELCPIVSRGWPAPSPLYEFDERVHNRRLDLDWRWHRVPFPEENRGGERRPPPSFCGSGPAPAQPADVSFKESTAG